jgi:hypothetical protein
MVSGVSPVGITQNERFLSCETYSRGAIFLPAVEKLFVPKPADLRWGPLRLNQ